MIRNRRQELRVTQEEIAKLADFNTKTISELERRKRQVRASGLERIWEVLRVAEPLGKRLARIRPWRLRLGVRLRELARRVGIAVNTLARLEKMRHKWRPYPSTLERVEAALTEIEQEQRARPDFRKMRLARGLTERQLARRAGLSKPTVQDLESNRRRSQRTTVAKIEAALNEATTVFSAAVAKLAREGLRLWKCELAKKAGVGLMTVTRFEAGRPVHPGTARKITDTLQKLKKQAHDAVRVQLATGSEIREAREARGLTQAELARCAGICKTSVVKIEKELVSPKPKTLAAIEHALANAVGVSNRLYPRRVKGARAYWSARKSPANGRDAPTRPNPPTGDNGRAEPRVQPGKPTRNNRGRRIDPLNREQQEFCYHHYVKLNWTGARVMEAANRRFRAALQGEAAVSEERYVWTYANRHAQRNGLSMRT
jgi:transcriptional regulator with XRE-family HTH domain